jgi:transcriptional regulator with XRE-family HTH domain
MNERARRIKELVMQSGKTYQELETITSVKKSSLQRYASGVTTKIPMDVIEKLETAFNVPRGYIMGWDAPPEELGTLAADVLLNPDLMRLAQIYMDLEQTDKDMLLMLAENMHQKTKKD